MSPAVLMALITLVVLLAAAASGLGLNKNVTCENMKRNQTNNLLILNLYLNVIQKIIFSKKTFTVLSFICFYICWF